MRISSILRENKRFWEKCFADSEFNFKFSPGENLLEIMERLKKNKSRRVLDLGCGLGRWSIALARAGFQIKAVDISSEAIKRVQKWAEKEGLYIETQVSPAQELDSERDGFDAVICNSVLDHMPLAEAQKVMFHLKNVLRPDGIAYVSFDGLEKEDQKKYVLLKDKTRRYISGKQKGMLWRFYIDEEIKGLCGEMAILEFRVRRNGKREVWLSKR